MEGLDFNMLFNRNDEKNRIMTMLNEFNNNKKNLLIKRGIYVYGNPGVGKTRFVMDLLKEMNYDIIKYDAGDVRNKSIIDMITKHNMSDSNIMSLFHKKAQRIAIVMDEIDGMNNGDKGGINSLIKLIRPKKTKKQKVEDITMNPIICIGNYHIDKKIKELMKVCQVCELKNPTNNEMVAVIKKLIPNLEESLLTNICSYINNDLRKLGSIYEIYSNQQSLLKQELIQNIFQQKSYNDDTKVIIKNLFNNRYNINDHLNIMNETDRTIIGLLLHENVIDILNKYKKSLAIPFYLKLLDNICFADYIDRITFQKQIWQFNEMSSLIKTFYNSYLINTELENKQIYNPAEVRFTKVLTKYSTEYNNKVFIQLLCNQIGIDEKCLFSYFLSLKEEYNDNELYNLFDNFELTKLDINRIYRYIDYTLGESVDNNDEVYEEI